MNSRLRNTLKVFDILRKEAKERGIDKVILNGDILEESDGIQTETYSKLYKSCKRLHDAGIDTTINLGNHDVVRQTEDSLVHSLVPFSGIARVVERPILLWDKVYVVPWTDSPLVFQDGIRHLRKKYGGFRNPSVLVAHIGIAGSKVGPRGKTLDTKFTLDTLSPEEFSLVLLSDFHTRQKIAKNVYYLGSPLQHNFGEVHEPAIWEIRLYAKPPWYRKIAIPTNLPKFVAATVSTSEDVDTLIRRHTGDYLRICVVDSGPNRSRVQDAYIEHRAKEKGCLIQIVREAEARERVQVPKVVNIERVIRKYASTRNLTRLGLKLFR